MSPSYSSRQVPTLVPLILEEKRLWTMQTNMDFTESQAFFGAFAMAKNTPTNATGRFRSACPSCYGYRFQSWLKSGRLLIRQSCCIRYRLRLDFKRYNFSSNDFHFHTETVQFRRRRWRRRYRFRWQWLFLKRRGRRTSGGRFLGGTM